MLSSPLRLPFRASRGSRADPFSLGDHLAGVQGFSVVEPSYTLPESILCYKNNRYVPCKLEQPNVQSVAMENRFGLSQLYAPPTGKKVTAQ